MLNVQADLTAAAEALRDGNVERANELYGRILLANPAQGEALLGLAKVCRMRGDEAGEIKAIDRLLATEPRNVEALLLKADHLHDLGETRSAAAFYSAAIKNVPRNQRLPAALIEHLQRAQNRCERYAAEYGEYIVDRLGRAGFGASSSERFAQSVDIMLGRKRVYLQQPRYYYFPGLPQIQFYGREQFPWLTQLEDATAAIREELLAVLDKPGAFAPYVQGHANRPRKEEAGMLDNPAWSAFYLCKDGDIVEENSRLCPRTMAALADVPFARVPKRSPSILFSLLKPGTHIPPHNGLVNTRLICHLPLIVPEGCEFRVGNDTRAWREGQAWLFDDTIEHEAWNRSAHTRVILIFDVWRPELSSEERALIAALFEAIDAHGGPRAEWSI